MSLRSSAFKKVLTRAAIVSLVLLGGYLVGVAVMLRVDLFDSYAIYLNARQIAEARPILYYWKSSPFLSLLYAPFFQAERFFAWPDFAVTAARVTAVGFYLLWVFAAYKLLSLFLTRFRALWGAACLALNLLIIHYAPFPKEDIPGAVFVALCFYFYLVFKEKGKKQDLVRAALCAGTAMSLRQQFMFLIPSTVLLYETAVCSFGSGDVATRIRQVLSRWFWSAVFFFFLPMLVPVALATGIYVFLGIDTVAHAPVRFFGEILLHLKILSSYRETWWEGYAFLIQACGWAVVLLALLGMGIVLKQKSRPGLFCLLWLLLFFIFQAHLIRHIEARFFLGTYTAVYVFAGMGFWRIYDILSGLPVLRPGLGRASRILFCAVVATSVLWPAVNESGKFLDPFYRKDFARKVASVAADLAGHGRVFWYGKMYPLHPKEFVFHPEDEATYLYHMYNHTLSFFLRRRIPIYVPSSGFLTMPGGSPVFAKGASHLLRDGDVMVVNTGSKTSTKNVPTRMPPLLIQRARKLRLPVVGTQGECLVFSLSPDAVVQGISVCKEGDGYRLRGWGFPDAIMEIDLLLRGRRSFSVLEAGIVRPVQGKFVQAVGFQRNLPFEVVRQADILYYDELRSLSPEA